jgi:TrmH family RNA methyltransferase
MAYTCARAKGAWAIAEERDWRGLAADVERAATPLGRRRLGCFSIEGLRLHERALRAGWRVEEVLVSAELRADPPARIARLLQELGDTGAPLRFAPREAVDRLTGGRNLGGILGLVRLPETPTLAEVIADGGEASLLLLVGVDVDDPGNLGALTRTALAAGAAAFISVGRGDPFHPRAVRTSMGSLFRLPLPRYETAELALRDLRQLGFRSLGALSRGGESLDDARFGHPRLALFVGNEAFGLSEELSGRLDEGVSIPMATEIDSYSVNAATAILLHTIRRGQTGR